MRPLNPSEPVAPTILVVDDEVRLAQLVSDYLVAAGYATHVLHEGSTVIEQVRALQPALIVLDLMLPGVDGLNLCRAIREFSQVPVLMLTARVEEIDRLLGLDAGADDYVCKPFSPRELVARVKAILRRSAGLQNELSTRLRIDEAQHRAYWAGQLLDLTPAEFRLLRTLAATPGRVYSRDQLLDHLHEDQRALNDRTVDSHIKNLRRKLDQAVPGTQAIRSVYGLGYAYEPE